MNVWHRFRTLAVRWTFASITWLCLAQQLLAQEEDTGPKVKSYGLPYLLVVLMMVLGLTLALRPSLREKEFRPPAD